MKDCIPTELAQEVPFKVLYEAPKYGRKNEPIEVKDAIKFKHRLPTYNYDKTMSRVKPMMQIHDHPSLEL